MDMDLVAKKILQGKKLKKAEPGKGKVKLPPAPTAERMAQKKSTTASAVSMDPKESIKKNTKAPTRKAPPQAKMSKNKSIAAGVAEEVAEKKPFNFKVPSIQEDIFKAPKAAGKKGFGKLAKRAAMAAGALAPVGLGVGLLMEGLDAEEAGGEEEDMEAAEMRQREKTTAKLKAEKAAKIPGSLGASTKKKVSSLPSEVKKTEVTVKRPPAPQSASDEEIVQKFNKRLDREFGPVESEGWDVVEKVMRDEFKGAAKRSNKKPISKYLKR